MKKDGKSLVWWVYIVRCRDDSLYTGITTDVKRRFKQHQNATGAKYLKSRSPMELVFQRRIGSKSQALKIEIAIKRFPKTKKLRIINERKYFKDTFGKTPAITKT